MGQDGRAGASLEKKGNEASWRKLIHVSTNTYIGKPCFHCQCVTGDGMQLCEMAVDDEAWNSWARQVAASW